MVAHREIGPDASIEFTEDETIHLVRNLGERDAIDLHLCGAHGSSSAAARFLPREPDLTVAVGHEFDADVVEDYLPVVMSKPGG